MREREARKTRKIFDAEHCHRTKNGRTTYPIPRDNISCVREDMLFFKRKMIRLKSNLLLSFVTVRKLLDYSFSKVIILPIL